MPPSRRLFALVLATVAGGSFGNVFGPDRRMAFDNTVPPFRAIGVVRQFTDRVSKHAIVETCSGSLVGKRLVLTAAHCVARDGDHLSPHIRTVFFPGGVRPDSEALGIAAVEVWAGEWRREADSRAGDWAILLLERSPDIAPLHVDAEAPTPGTSIAVFGYSADFLRGRALSGDLTCQVRALTDDGVYHHDCGTYAGASGGPAVRVQIARGQSPILSILGVHSAHRSRGTRGLQLRKWDGEYANLITGSPHFAAALEQARARDAR